MAITVESDHGHVIIIFNSIRPYAYEVNNILAVPDGFTYRFRFRHKWMPTIESPSDLVGRRGLVLLRDFDNAKFVPLRRIQVSNILEVGEVSYIEYVLEDIIEFDSDEQIRKRQLDEFNERMKAAIIGYENMPGENLEKLIFLYTDLAYGIRDRHYQGLEQNRVLNSWGNLTQIISQMECFTDFDFLKVVQIIDSKGEMVPIVVRSYPNTGRFQLRSSTIYRAHVFQRAFTHREGDSSVISRRQIAIKGEPGEVRTIQSTYSVAGKYDLYKYYFKTEPTPRTRNSSLYIEIHRDDIILPNIDIPISVSPGRAQKLVWAASVVGFTIGIALLFGADYFGRLTLLPADLLERIGILTMVVSSYGIGPIAKSLLERIGIEYQI
jgi:hypothetical protein